MVPDFTIPNRRVPHFILVHILYPTQEDRHSTATPSPSSNLAPLHCNGRKSLSVVRNFLEIAQHAHFQHLIIDFIRALEAFIFKVDTIGASDYYSNFASPLFVASTALCVTQTILADAIVVSFSHGTFAHLSTTTVLGLAMLCAQRQKTVGCLSLLYHALSQRG
jgi:hypothetical protein